jgi:DNA-binding transcriptional regulator GbsR (MarR family)
MKFLAEIGMVIKEREPGRRRDHYRLGDDLWYRSTVTQNQALVLWEKAAGEGAELLGTDSAAGRRLDETRRFFEFLRGEMPLLIERWQQLR